MHTMCCWSDYYNNRDAGLRAVYEASVKDRRSWDRSRKLVVNGMRTSCNAAEKSLASLYEGCGEEIATSVFFQTGASCNQQASG